MYKICIQIFNFILIWLFLFSGCSVLRTNKNIKFDSGAWTMYGGAYSRTNFSNVNISPPFKPIWEYDADAGFSAYSFTASDSVLFVGTLKGEVHLVNSVLGKKISKQSFGEAIIGTPIVNVNLLYIPVANGGFSLGEYDLSARKFNWSVQLSDIETSPMIYGSQIFISTSEGKLVAIDKRKGIINWVYEDPREMLKPFHSSPATDGRVVICGNDNGNLYAVDLDNGKLCWKFRTDGSILATPSIYLENVVFGSTDGFFYAVSITNGKLIWKKNIGVPIYASQAVADSFVYFGGSDGICRCMNINTGVIQWTFKAQSVIKAAPLVTKDYVFLGSLDEHLYVLDRSNGNLIWSYLLKGRVQSTPVIWDKYLYVLTDEHIITAFAHREDKK
jgi:eukaryotic-like serine/threonine-protein kinase